MTNFEKVKEMMRLEDSYNGDNPFCDAVGRLKQEECCTMFCEECYEWLKQEYKEPPKPMLTDKEREYLSAVIKPWRDDVQIIKKAETTCRPEELETYIPEEYIAIITAEFDNAVLPCFEKGKYYKNMETNEGYTLEELGL